MLLLQMSILDDNYHSCDTASVYRVGCMAKHLLVFISERCTHTCELCLYHLGPADDKQVSGGVLY